jgi:hypothetical protein
MVSVEFQNESQRMQVKALPLNVEVDIIPFVGSPGPPAGTTEGRILTHPHTQCTQVVGCVEDRARLETVC